MGRVGASCNSSRSDRRASFGEVVVHLDGIDKGKPFVEGGVPQIEAKDCLFLPFATVVRDDQSVTVVNMDPVMHDIQA